MPVRRGNPRSCPGGRRLAWLRGLLASPALMALTATPLAAGPRLLLVPMCTAEGPRLVPLPGGSRTGGPGDERGHDRIACAHALCPRELLSGRKARSPA